jgi:hypothetical protein
MPGRPSASVQFPHHDDIAAFTQVLEHALQFGSSTGSPDIFS